MVIFSGNWDVRDNNLKKQAHLLTAAELKRRGITRYDAEIILAQGISLPEPKSESGEDESLNNNTSNLRTRRCRSGNNRTQFTSRKLDRKHQGNSYSGKVRKLGFNQPRTPSRVKVNRKRIRGKYLKMSEQPVVKKRCLRSSPVKEICGKKTTVAKDNGSGDEKVTSSTDFCETLNCSDDNSGPCDTVKTEVNIQSDLTKPLKPPAETKADKQHLKCKKSPVKLSTDTSEVASPSRCSERLRSLRPRVTIPESVVAVQNTLRMEHSPVDSAVSDLGRN